MAQVFLVITVLGWAIMVFGLWQAAVMLASWRSAAAVVMKSDYTETDQWQDRWTRGSFRLLSSDWSWLDGQDTRLVNDEIVYTPADGRQRHGLVSRRVMRAWWTSPSGAYLVWYEESNPDRVTTRGPWNWLAIALAGVLMLGVSIHALTRAGGLAVALAQLPGAQLTGHH